MGPQAPKDLARDVARNLSSLAGELAALKGDATHWLADLEYAILRHRLEAAHAAVEAALDDAEVREGPKQLLEEVRGAAGEGRIPALLELLSAPRWIHARRGALPVLRTTGGPDPDGEDLPDHGARRAE